MLLFFYDYGNVFVCFTQTQRRNIVTNRGNIGISPAATAAAV